MFKLEELEPLVLVVATAIGLLLATIIVHGAAVMALYSFGLAPSVTIASFRVGFSSA